jgi:hypothetical protein
VASPPASGLIQGLRFAAEVHSPLAPVEIDLDLEQEVLEKGVLGQAAEPLARALEAALQMAHPECSGLASDLLSARRRVSGRRLAKRSAAGPRRFAQTIRN